MTTQSGYIVNTSQTQNSAKYTIIGPNDQIFKFYKASSLKFNLVINEDNVIINVNRDTPLSYIYKLKFYNFPNFVNIRLYCKPFSNFRVVGSYLSDNDDSGDTSNKEEINWYWLPAQDSSGCYILIDSNDDNNHRVMARMFGLSLEGFDSGILCIAQGVEDHWHQVILITSCLIWEFK